VIDLDAALFDLAEHLDHPAAENLADVVLGRVTPGVAPARRRMRAALAVAAAVVVLTAALLSIGPARHAIADWLGIGAVEVRHSEGTVPPATGANTVPGAPGTGTAAPGPVVARQLGTARAAVKFVIETPRTASAGALAGVEVDRRVPDGLVVLRYPRFTLVEIASQGGNGPIVRKMLGAVPVENVSVAGVPGLWISGAHEVGYVGRDGSIRTDTVRRSGPVLLWERGDVTYRIEGVDRRADALAIARTLR
jgi:hypothetical protein